MTHSDQKNKKTPHELYDPQFVFNLFASKIAPYVVTKGKADLDIEKFSLFKELEPKLPSDMDMITTKDYHNPSTPWMNIVFDDLSKNIKLGFISTFNSDDYPISQDTHDDNADETALYDPEDQANQADHS